jgi:hypothetical protein
VRTGLATLASLACTWYVPGRAEDATVTQPGTRRPGRARYPADGCAGWLVSR